MYPILPKILAVITRKDRYKVDIEWSSNSWTHNVFRLWELIFWRREGVKPEMSVSAHRDKDGIKVVYYCHSFESVIALFETHVREALKWRFKLPYKIWIPIIQTPSGIPVLASPYLFAIALDANGPDNQRSTLSTTLTYAHTCTGSNLVLVVGALDNNDQTFTGATYATVAVTNVDNYNQVTAVRMWTGIQTAPTTGSNNIVITVTLPPTNWLDGVSTSYSGCAQTGQPDSFAQNSGAAGSTLTTTTTVVATGCWLWGCGDARSALLDASTMTLRARSTNDEPVAGDSNGTVGTGSQSLQISEAPGTGDQKSLLIMSISPFVAVVTVSRLLLMGVG